MVKIQLGGHIRGSSIRGYAIVDECDKDVADLSWHMDGSGYAKRHRPERQEYLHMLIVARMIGRSLETGEVPDHKNLDRLDNRRDNLRITSGLGNRQHRLLSSNNTSGYRGVCWDRRRGRWMAYVKHMGKQIFCGHFVDILEAAQSAHAKRTELGFLGEESRNPDDSLKGKS